MDINLHSPIETDPNREIKARPLITYVNLFPRPLGVKS